MEAFVLGRTVELGRGAGFALPPLFRMSAPKPITAMTMSAIAPMSSGDGRRGLVGCIGGG